MPRRPAKITQSEITRTIKGAVNAGCEVVAVSVNHQTGDVKLCFGGAAPTSGAAEIDKMLGIS